MNEPTQDFRLAGQLGMGTGFGHGTVALDGALPTTVPTDANGEFSMRCSIDGSTRIGVGGGAAPLQKERPAGSLVSYFYGGELRG